MSLRTSHMELFCRDTATTAAWWQRAMGATLEGDMAPFMFMKVWGLDLLLRPGTPGFASTYRAADMSIVFFSDDLEGIARLLTDRGVRFGHGDEDACLTFQDPDGHWIQITDQQI